ncbi:MAG: ABC transporter permease, partial [Burkholderiales bacterium]
MNNPRHTAWRWAGPVVVGVLFLAAWHLAVTLNDVPFYIVPSPVLVLQTLVEDWPLLWRSLLVTLEVTGMALLLSVLLGTT